MLQKLQPRPQLATSGFFCLTWTRSFVPETGNFRREPRSQHHATIELFVAGSVFQQSGKEVTMAGVDVGSQGGKKRATNSDINMIPFIDLMMTTIAFLLITAVWVTNSRVNASADVPGQDGCRENCPTVTEKTLHLSVNDNDFALSWKQAGTVLTEVHIPKSPTLVGDADKKMVRYPELAKAISKEWSERGAHVDPTDRKPDQAVLHTDNKLPFNEIVAVLDALNGTRRDLKMPDGSTTKVPAFNSTFAIR
jgi:biopolymer transport protein ExbD